MVKDFPRTLSLLRQEKGISQRQAATDFQISQALLSHYENGVREPGLAFVVKAADYYGVSCDFLLGRTMLRDGSAIHSDSLPDASEDKGNVLKGSALAMLSKKLLVNTINILFDLLSRSNNRALISWGAGYLTLAVYKMFRILYHAGGSGNENIFATPQSCFSELCDSKMKLLESRMREYAAMAEARAELPDMSVGAIEQAYPALAPSLFSLLHDATERLTDKKD